MREVLGIMPLTSLGCLLLFSHSGSRSRLIVIHGGPGVGKASIAQKLAFTLYEKKIITCGAELRDLSGINSADELATA